ncbi:hypothetical protein [Oceanithermus sp.]
MLHKTKYVLLGVFVTALGLWGLAVTIPNSFSSGEVVSATKMNENFQALKDAVDALEAKLAAVQAGQQAPPTQTGKLAYVWVTGGTADATYRFNPSGGDITVSSPATGVYDVTFAGLDLGAGGVVQVTGYGLDNTYCKVRGWDTLTPPDTVVQVRCYDATGAAVDARFTVLVLR